MSSYEISKSSLLSLKAEILRKEEDLVRAKLDNVEKIKTIQKKSLELKNKGVEARQLNDLNDEEQDLLKLSKSKLEVKSKLYEKLSGASVQNEEINRKYLVRFDKKSKVPDQTSPDVCDPPDLPVESEDEDAHHSDDYDKDIDPAEEWVEYTDCFGRSRKCLRKDLHYFMSKDADLKQLHDKRQQATPLNVKGDENTQSETNVEGGKQIEDEQNEEGNSQSEMVSADMRREMLRKKWEQEEEELKNKSNIYYQNVLFNEARQHGVGYYGFSKDEEERAKQQEALKQLRIETEQQQKKAQDLKALREKQMAARIKAARNRKRARLGLPPEEDEPEPTPPDTHKDTEDEKKKKEEAEKSEEVEKMLIEARKRHVRPWDIGKEGVTEFYEMTQEEWNEKKRQERPTEFAPPQAYKSFREFSGMRAVESDVDNDPTNINKTLNFSTTKRKDSTTGQKRKLRNINPYKDSNRLNEAKPQDNSIHHNLSKSSSVSATQQLPPENSEASSNNLYDPEDVSSESDEEDDNLLNQPRDHYRMSKTSTVAFQPTPIVNEVEEADFDDALLADYQRMMQNTIPVSEESSRNKGVEIPPPPTFDYFGPTTVKKVRSSSGQINIADSIEAGLRFLRNQAEQKGKHCDDIF